ncbi:hypothetical protein [Methylobacterium nodulans]|uniref:hypothetical protein n=1 Tax=Methylobacterium nodulans TaxID=114616 RepID=UPI0012EE6C26|nr:hypothetical protein [Methylobacterium nodulans]
MNCKVKTRSEVEAILLNRIREFPNGHLVRRIEIVTRGLGEEFPGFNVYIEDPLPDNSTEIVEFIQIMMVTLQHV